MLKCEKVLYLAVDEIKYIKITKDSGDHITLSFYFLKHLEEEYLGHILDVYLFKETAYQFSKMFKCYCEFLIVYMNSY